MPLQCLTQAPPSLKGQTKMCRPTGAPAMPQATDAVDDSLQPVQVPNPRESDRVPRHAPVGDPLDITKDPSRTRFLFQNPNGISVGAGGDLESVLKHAQDMKCDHLVLPETKLDTYNRRVKSQVHNHCRRICGLGEYRLVTAASPIEFKTSFKPGGILAVTMGHLRGRVLETGSDKLGRWVYTKFSGSGDSNITVIGVYQPCDQNVKSAGATTATTQQYSLLEGEDRLDPHRVRKHYAQDLLKFVKQCQQQKELVCVGGDFNETLGDDARGLTELCNTCGLVDVNLDRHSTDTHSFETHLTGSRCIDYILVDPALKDSILACGYEPFNFRILGDHRGVYMDVDTRMFFGSDTVPCAALKSRQLQSRKVKQIVPYFEALHQELTRHNWFEQIKELERQMQQGQAYDPLAEKLDQRRISASKYAASQLPSYPGTPYSPEIAQLRNIEALLKSAISQFTNPQDDYLERIDRIKLKLNSIGFEIPPTIQECRMLRQQNKKMLRALERDELRSGAARENHLDSLITYYQQGGVKLSEKAVKKIKRAEANAKVWKQVAAARGLNRGGGLSHVWVPQQDWMDPAKCREWKKIDDPAKVREAVSARLQLHFSQSKDCNLTSPPLDVTMDFEGTCHKAESILNGTYNTDNMDEATKWLLEHLKYTVGSKEAIESKLTEGEFQGKIKAWDERTSTSPITGVHLGHAKAYYALTHLQEDSEEEERFEALRNEIIHGHLVLLNYALQFGYSYKRWQNIVNALLEKDPGMPKIHRLRVIHLYEWDFNLILGVKWRHLLHRLCDEQLVNPSCYGGVPGKTTHDPVFIREMEYELCRLLRRPMIHFDNDAKSCYDRIPCFLANVASRKYGMSAKVCIVQGKTLREAKYYLKTKFKLTDEYVSHTLEMPWFGTGQGSGNSPMYWLVISSTLFDIYEKHASGGAVYQSPDRSMSMKLLQLGFVDDVMNRTAQSWETANPEESLKQLIKEASKDSQLWHDLLEASNQTLELKKCNYHFIHYKFAESGAPEVALETRPPAKLTVKDKNMRPVEIKHVPNDTAIKYLGFRKCIANQKEQRAVLLKKANDFARVVNCSPLTRRGAHTFYRGIYKLSIDYVLPITHFTLKELTLVQKKAHRAFLSKCGYRSNMALAIQYGPKCWGGTEFFHLYDLQGFGQVACFIKYWRTPHTQSGQILRVVMAWIQYCTGTSWSILEQPQEPLPHLESSWIKSMREYLAKIDGKLTLKDQYIPEPQRQNDTYIMDHVLSHDKFKPAHIKAINWCRMYLGVVTVSDIANAAGTHISKAMFDGDLDKVPTSSGWLTVHQKKPDPKSWAVWRRACRLIAGSADLVLQTPLSAWVVPTAQMRRLWKTWKSPGVDKLYIRQPNGTFNVHLRLTRDYDGDPTEQGSPLPATAMPVDAKQQQFTWSVTPNHRGWAIPVQDLEIQTDIQAYIQTLPEWEVQLLKGLQLEVSQTTLFDSMLGKQIVIAADGSKQEAKASFAWVLSDKAGNRLAKCADPAFGAKPSSYRAEGYSILSATRFLHHIYVKWKVRCNATIYCDNESMVKRAALKKDITKVTPNSTRDSEWDVLAEIWSTAVTVPDWGVSWIRGHQDSKVPVEKLSLEAQLNVEADELADKYIEANPDLEYETVPLLPASGIQLELNIGTVTHHMKRELRLARTAAPMKAYLCRKFDWDEETFENVDWESFRLAMGRLKQHSNTLTKHVNDITPVGRRVHRYDPKYPRGCISCGLEEETADHLLLCPRRDKWRKDCMTAIREYLEKADTDLALQELILEGTKSVLEDRSPETIHHSNTVAHLAQAQTQIGWMELFRGRMPSQWKATQHNHLGERATPKKNGQTWATGLAQTFLQQWHLLWTLRNGDRHGTDYKSREEAARRQAIREVSQVYSTYQGVIQPKHNWILATPLEQRLKNRTYVLRAWINSYEPVLKKSHEYQTCLETG